MQILDELVNRIRAEQNKIAHGAVSITLDYPAYLTEAAKYQGLETAIMIVESLLDAEDAKEKMEPLK